jgi:hypothetical protein
MRTILLIATLITLFFIEYHELSAQTPAPAKTQVLFDFRVDRNNTPPLKISPVTENSVLAKLFRRYLNDPDKCNQNFEGNGSDPLRSARDAGQIAPDIVDMAKGSFTAAGQTQTLYLIAVNECNASHAENYGTKRAAIFSGQQLIANVDVDFKNTIVRKTDLNGDGIDELLMTAGDMHQGVVDEVAGLVEFPNGKLRVIQDFGAVLEDGCPSGMQGSSTTAAVISIAATAPGKMPKLLVDNYEASCTKNRRWRLVK